MAVKWHVNDEKKPGKCSAKMGQCPFGADTPHYGTKREAEAAAEELIAHESAGFNGEAKASALTECEDGSGLAVDAAGRWYRDGTLVENMMEAVSDEGEPVMLTDEEFRGSVVSDAETDVRIHAGRIDDLVNVGCYSNYDDGMNMSMIGGDATVERAFGVSVGYVGDDAHVGLLTDHREPGDTSSFAIMSQVDDMRDRAVIDTVDGETRVFGMMGESRIGVLTGTASVDEMSGTSRIDVVESGGVVEHVTGDAHVGEVWNGGRVDQVTGKGASVMSVGSGGSVGAVTGGATVVDVGASDASEACLVESVDSHSKVSLLDCGADVTYECGENNVSPARAREFIVKRLNDDATGVGGECLSRANGDNPFERSNVRLRVRDADGRVVDVPDVDGVLRDLVEVDDDEREMMWEQMMGSPDSK